MTGREFHLLFATDLVIDQQAAAPLAFFYDYKLLDWLTLKRRISDGLSLVDLLRNQLGNRRRIEPDARPDLDGSKPILVRP